MSESAKTSMIGAPSRVIPEPIKEILQAMSDMRRTVLMQNPQLLPQLAPYMLKAEHGIDTLWHGQ